MTEVEWANLKAAEIKALAEQDAIAVVPIAALEQHGPHLPTQVDTRLCGEVARRAARQIAESQPVVVLPVIWSGLSEHHMPFNGTITLDLMTFAGMLRCVCQSIERHGFRRAFVLNGHGGNIQPLNVVLGELAAELDVAVATGTYWLMAEKEIAAILERQKGVQHACEAETSMMLALAPELVDRSRLEEATGLDDPALPAGTYRWRSFAERTRTGVIGDARAATADKGERLLAAAAEALARVLRDPATWG